MELKTKKQIIKDFLLSAVGGGAYALGIVYASPIVGLLGFFLIAGYGCDFIFQTAKGLNEIIDFKKKYKNRDIKYKKIKKKNLEKEQFEVEDYKLDKKTYNKEYKQENIISGNIIKNKNNDLNK